MDCKDGICKITKNDSTDIKIPYPTDSSGWVMYGRKNCVYCVKAIEELKLKEQFTYINVEKYGGAHNIREKLKSKIGTHNTVPIIFYNSKFIGGYNELINYNKTICGGISTKPTLELDDAQKLIDKFKGEIENKLNMKFTIYKAIAKKTQVVAGVNYFIKILTDNEKYLHVRIYCPLGEAEPSLISHKYPVLVDEELGYF